MLVERNLYLFASRSRCHSGGLWA